MRVLSIIHGEGARSGLFGRAVQEAGHELVERSYTLADLPPDPPENYDAVMVFGGAMNVHEVDAHRWIPDEIAVLERLLVEKVPLLGVCLGSQMLAVASGVPVTRSPKPEIGWHEIETTPEAASDPLFAGAPARFTGFQWHSYQFAQPAGSVVLARSPVCLQAYRIGETAWGIQFHAEVTKEIAADWISHYRTDPDAIAIGLDPERERERLDAEIGRWNGFGRKLVDAFLGVAAARSGIRPEPATA